MRKLSCSALLDVVKSCFSKIIDETTSRNGLVSISDCLMSAYAMFSLKYPSLLQFDKHFREDIIRHNLKRVYEIGRVENWRAHHYNNHVSSPRSSNRTCATNASGFRSKYHAFALDTSAIVCGIG